MTQNLAELIDHTLLRPDATITDIGRLCGEAREHGFYAVCLNGYWISTAKKMLEGSGVKIVAVAGFPLGATLSKAKAQETRDAVDAGADEIDMVINIGAALEGHWDFIEHEIHEVTSAALGKPVKVIVESCYFSVAQLEEACRRAVAGRAAAVKTSTGFGPAGATVEAVRAMRKVVGCTLGVKASGGIKDRATAEAMIAAGASRLGTSGSVAIVRGS